MPPFWQGLGLHRSRIKIKYNAKNILKGKGHCKICKLLVFQPNSVFQLQVDDACDEDFSPGCSLLSIKSLQFDGSST